MPALTCFEREREKGKSLPLDWFGFGFGYNGAQGTAPVAKRDLPPVSFGRVR